MEIGRSFGYLFKDERWVGKFLILLAMQIFGVLIVPAFIAVGYQARLTKAILAGHDVPLPEWDRFGEDLGEGVKLTVLYLVYLLPIPLAIGAAFPLSVVDRSGVVLGLSLVLAALFVTIYAIIFAVARPAVFGAYVEGGDSIGAGLDVARVWRIFMQRAGDMILAAVLNLGLALGMTTLVGSCCLTIVAVPYTSFVEAHLWAQALRERPPVEERSLAPD